VIAFLLQLRFGLPVILNLRVERRVRAGEFRCAIGDLHFQAITCFLELLLFLLHEPDAPKIDSGERRKSRAAAERVEPRSLVNMRAQLDLQRVPRSIPHSIALAAVTRKT